MINTATHTLVEHDFGDSVKDPKRGILSLQRPGKKRQG